LGVIDPNSFSSAQESPITRKLLYIYTLLQEAQKKKKTENWKGAEGKEICGKWFVWLIPNPS